MASATAAPTANYDSGFGQEFQTRTNVYTNGTTSSHIGADTSDNGSWWGTFGFSIPTDATINGFQVRMRGWDSFGDGGTWATFQLTPDAGTTLGTSTRIPTSGDFGGTSSSAQADHTVGGSTDLMGLTSPTPTQINSTDFRILVVAVASDSFQSEFELQYLEITVHYTEAGGGGGSRSGRLTLLGVG